MRYDDWITAHFRDPQYHTYPNAREGWNTALEQAAKLAEDWPADSAQMHEFGKLAMVIRGLKEER